MQVSTHYSEYQAFITLIAREIDSFLSPNPENTS